MDKNETVCLGSSNKGNSVSLQEKTLSVRSNQQLVNLLEQRPVITLEEMQEALDSASRATVFRHLAKVSYRRSYNHNGRYYTKHDPTRYDRHGLFSYRGIHFSRNGNLVATVSRFICESSSGMTQRELQEILQVRVQTSLLAMVHDKKIARKKLAGQFIYFHPEPGDRTVQVAKRQEMLEAYRFNIDEVTNEVVIQVLLVLIRHPGSRKGDVARRLKGHFPPITIRHVEVVFDRYNLEDVEKKVE